MTGSGRELVGVLGGMGPAATADFYTKLIRRTPATVDQQHLRVAIWADPGVPDRVGAVLDGSTDPYPALLDGARKLASLGATLVAMPCHTANFFLPRLVADTGLAFVDMVAETVTELTRRHEHGATVGILATTATLRSELYQSRLAGADLPFVLGDAAAQRDVDEAIRQVKAGAPEAGRAPAERAVGSLRRAGAGTVLLACTELPVALGASVRDGGRVVDPTDVLALAVVRECVPAG
jgi:aspartate racemase